MAVAIVLAVYIPPHAPAPGQACRTWGGRRRQGQGEAAAHASQRVRGEGGQAVARACGSAARGPRERSAAHDVLARGLVDFAREEFSVALEGRDDVERLSWLAGRAAGADCAAVDLKGGRSCGRERRRVATKASVAKPGTCQVEAAGAARAGTARVCGERRRWPPGWQSTMRAGRSRRPIAMRQPGMFLSQPAIETLPSYLRHGAGRRGGGGGGEAHWAGRRRARGALVAPAGSARRGRRRRRPQPSPTAQRWTRRTSRGGGRRGRARARTIAPT